ncbi:helix-turn-helix domain-containing protein [Kribbella sp. CA-294648]|uniref:helix-turn-helix domain-containing protein n=1 Tax=Kribbella sp. CA-294648 TaxID=3239948 RepID=UPI003D91AA31
MGSETLTTSRERYERPVGTQRRRELGAALRSFRRKAGLTQTDVVAKLAWRKTRISLIETGRVRLDPADAAILADLWTVQDRSSRVA